MSFSVEWKYWNKHSPSNPLLYIAIYRYKPSWRRNGKNDEKWAWPVTLPDLRSDLHHIDWAEPPVYVAVGRCWPVLLQNIKPEDTKPSSTTSHSSSQSKVSKKVRYSKYGEISFNLLRIIIKYSNIKYLTDICFNNGLNVNNKTLLQLNIIGQSDQRKSNMTW